MATPVTDYFLDSRSLRAVAAAMVILTLASVALVLRYPKAPATMPA